MLSTKILPDFVTVDGGEGGTGAAPLEFSNGVGMPLTDGLVMVDDYLRGFGLRDEITVIASGKIVTGFDIVRTLSLGADLCNSARGMMFALGCIQALTCHSNECPTGITTQDPARQRGLVVEDKKVRVANFHAGTVRTAAEILGAAALKTPDQVKRSHLRRRVSPTEVKRFDQIYPIVEIGSMLGKAEACPERYARSVEVSDPDHFYEGQ
jgi:glutamate synthase domain-containing protein 2